MTNFYFIRHGKTEWNLQSRYQGAHGDSPLLPESYHEIELLAKFLAPVPFVHAYASPIKRARKTAECLVRDLPGDIPLTLDSRLREFDLGKMEGMKFTKVEEEWPGVEQNFHYHADRYDEKIVDGESFPSVIKRMGKAVREYARNYPNDTNILIVSHGAALNAGINGLLDVDLAHLKDRGGLSNTSTTILTTDDAEHFRLKVWNETDYLHKTKVDPTDTI